MRSISSGPDGDAMSMSSGQRFGVQAGAWNNLPDDIAVMVAPPITVTATAASRPARPRSLRRPRS